MHAVQVIAAGEALSYKRLLASLADLLPGQLKRLGPPPTLLAVRMKEKRVAAHVERYQACRCDSNICWRLPGSNLTP